MSNWQLDYHHALQLRMLGLAVIFGLVLPTLYLLVLLVRTAVQHFVQPVLVGEHAARAASHSSAALQ